MIQQSVWDDLFIVHRLKLLFLFDFSFSELIRTLKIKEHNLLEISPNRRKEVIIFQLDEVCTATRVFFNISNSVIQRNYDKEAPQWILYNTPFLHNADEAKYINELLSEFSRNIKKLKTTL